MGELIFIGIGLWDEHDITLRGVEAARKCDEVYAEFYTSKPMGMDILSLQKLIGKRVQLVKREELEEGSRGFLGRIKEKKVALLVGGDSMIATTHISLRLQAAEIGIATKVIPGISIQGAVPSLLGLQSYKFGRSTTLVYPEPAFFPLSPYEVIKDNKERGLHTLILLDLKDETYMTANEGIRLLLKMEEQVGQQVVTEDSLMAVVGRAGSPDPVLRAGTTSELLNESFGPPLHTLVFLGGLHFMEERALKMLTGWRGRKQ
jgi:diphthine synthase